jgi:hypothetical protein
MAVLPQAEPKESLLPLATAWGNTVDFNVLFRTYASLMIRWSPKKLPSINIKKVKFVIIMTIKVL